MPDLITEKRDNLFYITLNRPQQLNALTPAMYDDLANAWKEFAEDDNLLVAIISGAGDKAFCAGADLGQLITAFTSGERKIVSNDPIWLKGVELYKPIIAAVRGYAIAGGTEILQMTDIRVASEDSVFGLAEPKWGLFPGGGSTIRLPRQIPWAKAMEILLTGDSFNAQEAYNMGLINKVVPTGEVMSTAEKIAWRICQNGPIAVKAIKEAAIRGLNLSWQDAFQVETNLTRLVYSSEDAVEGPKAFMEKRKPKFKGR